MQCPRCRIQISGKSCPQCGIEITPIGTEAPEGTADQPATRRESETYDWRLQIKHKLVEHAEKKGREDRKEKPQPKATKTESKRPLFDYSLGDSAQGLKKQRVVTFTSTRESQPVVEKPLIRTPVGTSRGPRSHLPTQQALTLEAPAAPEPVDSSASTSEETAASENGLSHEVLFSRMLAGIIDLFLPVLIAVVFSFSAAKILNFDFFSANSLHLGILVALSFFFLNSFFFLILSGQTPGMYLTDLQLVGEESETVPFQSLVIRICLFLPVVVTVVGLLWSIFDPWCRGAHDRVSGTRVVPITHGSSGAISTSRKN